jgi:hypothetical protein
MMDWSKSSEPPPDVVDKFCLATLNGLFFLVLFIVCVAALVCWLDTIPGAGGSP